MDNRVLNILSTEKLDIGEATEPNSVLHIQSSGNVGSIEQTPGKLCICEKGNTGKGNDFTLSIDPSAWRMGNPPKESELLDVRGSVSDTAKLSKGH